jgi:hypothetical protein
MIYMPVGEDNFACMPSRVCRRRVTLLACFACQVLSSFHVPSVDCTGLLLCRAQATHRAVSVTATSQCPANFSKGSRRNLFPKPQPTVLCLSPPPHSALPMLPVLPCPLSRLQLPTATAPSSLHMPPARHLKQCSSLCAFYADDSHQRIAFTYGQGGEPPSFVAAACRLVVTETKIVGHLQCSRLVV